MPRTVVVASLLAAQLALVASSSVCSSNPYSLILPLSTFAPALSFCSSKYPVAPLTSTKTLTATTTSTLSGSTITLNGGTITATPSTVTLGGTVIVESTTTDFTSTETDASTVTVDVTGAANLKRSSPSQSALWSSISKALGSSISTACSCIETPQTVVVTATSTTTIKVSLPAATTTLPPHTVVPPASTLSLPPATRTSVVTDYEATTLETVVTQTSTLACPGATDAPGGGSPVPGGGSCGCSYTTYCDTVLTFPGESQFEVANAAMTLEDCTIACDNSFACSGAQFTIATNTCILLDYGTADTFVYSSTPGIDLVLLIDDTCTGVCAQG